MEMVFLMEEFRESIRLYRQLVNYGSGKVQLAEIVNTPHRNQFDHSRSSSSARLIFSFAAVRLPCRIKIPA